MLCLVYFLCVRFDGMYCVLFDAMSCVLFDAMSQWYVLCTFCVYFLMLCLVVFFLSACPTNRHLPDGLVTLSLSLSDQTDIFNKDMFLHILDFKKNIWKLSGNFDPLHLIDILEQSVIYDNLSHVTICHI